MKWAILRDYKEKEKELPFLETHPTQDVIVHLTLAGKKALKYQALMNIANDATDGTQDMLKRIFERGVDKEFEYWRSRDE